MSFRERLPIALTIAGSDSSGGAGIQADLKTFASLGVHGTTAITCVTAQHPKGVLGIQACSSRLVGDQIIAVFSELTPAAVKTGMLFSAPIIGVVVDWFAGGRRPPLIVDPVMVATSRAKLLKPDAIKLLQRDLLPLATLVTPNVDETELLLKRTLKSVKDLRSAAKELHERCGCAALVKGGHLRGLEEAVDVFYDGKNELVLRAPFVRGVYTHGTGCTYSAAITAWLAKGVSLAEAVTRAKKYITVAIRNSQRAAGHSVLNHFSQPRGRTRLVKKR
jgi:hydroxymethylpyrimidine/phosphomethylpyrimidine kinase